MVDLNLVLKNYSASHIIPKTFSSLFQTCAARILGCFLVYAFFTETLSPWSLRFLLFLPCYNDVSASIDQSLIHIPLFSFPSSWSSWRKQWWRHTVDYHHHTWGRTYRDLQNDWQRSTRVTITFIQGPTRVSSSNNALLSVLCGACHFKHSLTYIKSLFHLLAFRSADVQSKTTA